MPFYRFGEPGKDSVAHFNFGRKKATPEKCCMPRFPEDDGGAGQICGRMSVALCDSAGCDKPVCELHRTKHPTKPNTDFCADHKSQAEPRKERPLKPPDWMFFVPVVILAAAVLVLKVPAQGPTTGPDRLDFIATDGQVAFSTAAVFPIPASLQVFRNGQLQTQGAAADYTQKASSSGASIKVAFNDPLQAGRRVTLFYWRQ